MTDGHSRALAKAVTWRLSGLVTTTAVVWWYTGRPGLAAGAGLLEAACKVLLYYLHERAWNRMSFGRTLPGKPRRTPQGPEGPQLKRGAP